MWKRPNQQKSGQALCLRFQQSRRLVGLVHQQVLPIHNGPFSHLIAWLDGCWPQHHNRTAHYFFCNSVKRPEPVYRSTESVHHLWKRFSRLRPEVSRKFLQDRRNVPVHLIRTGARLLVGTCSETLIQEHMQRHPTIRCLLFGKGPDGSAVAVSGLQRQVGWYLETACRNNCRCRPCVLPTVVWPKLSL